MCNCWYLPKYQVFGFSSKSRVSRYGSEDSKSKRISNLHYWFKSYNNLNNVFCKWFISAFFSKRWPSVEMSKCPSVCVFVRVFVCVFTFEVPFKRLFAPTQKSTVKSKIQEEFDYKTLQKLQNAAQRTSYRLSRCQNVLTKKTLLKFFLHILKFVSFQVFHNLSFITSSFFLLFSLEFDFCHHLSFVTTWILSQFELSQFEFCHIELL